MLGGPGCQPLLQHWTRSMPFSINGDTSTFTFYDPVFKLEDWWHGPRGIECVPARADLSVVSNGGYALIAGFESPLRAGRSVVALISAPGESEVPMNAALLAADVLPSLQGAMNVIHGRSVTVTSNGEAYYVGKLAQIAYLRGIFSSHPLLLLLGGVIAALFYRVLRAIAVCRIRE